MFDADYIDDDCEVVKLEDGRIAIEVDGVDHKATPRETAKCINKLEKKLKKNQEVVEICLGDDCLWWAIVPKA